MARSSSKKSSGMNRNIMIVAFCVVAGTLVTACQPQLMQNLDQAAPAESPMMTASPAPSGEPMGKDATPAEVNAKIDSSIKFFDAAMSDGNANELSGSDLK